MLKSRWKRISFFDCKACVIGGPDNGRLIKVGVQCKLGGSDSLKMEKNTEKRQIIEGEYKNGTF